MKKFTPRNLFVVLSLIFVFLAFPTPSSAQGQSVFGPKDFRISMIHFHLSVHSFSVEGGGDGVILVNRKTPDKEFEGGFLLLNSQVIGLHDFLEGNNQNTEKKVSLRSRNYLTVFLLGTPGAAVSIEVKKGAVTPAPQVTFQAVPQAITLGETSTLQWTTTNADRITIDQGIGDVAAGGSLTVSPKNTTTYTLTATGKGGTATGIATVSLTIPTPTVSLSVNPDAIVQGASATLTWISTFADTVNIQPGIGAVSASGSLTVSPVQTTTYSITATGHGGTANATATLTVLPPPTATLGASPQTIIAGASTTLSWSSTNATTATIEPGIGTVSPTGSMTVTPQQTTIYVITVTGPSGSASTSVSVTVHQAPTVTLSASPQTVAAGAPLTLTWISSNAVAAILDNGIGAVPTIGSIQVAPSQTTTYNIMVTGPGGSANATATVTVIAAPSVNISAAQAAIMFGETTVLSWSSSNAETASIEPGIGVVSLNGSITVSPIETTLYIIRVSGPGGSAGAAVTVSVIRSPTVQLSASPRTIVQGESFTLTWKSSYASSGSITQGVGYVSPNGSTMLSPDVTTTYTITVRGLGGTATASVTVLVVGLTSPTFVTIGASPETIRKDGTSILSWSSPNGQTAFINNGVGTVALEGSISVSPQFTTTYTISVTGPKGPASDEVTISVLGSPDLQPEGSFGSRYQEFVPRDSVVESYDPRRFSLITGLVQTGEGFPLSEVSVRILGHPEYGTSATGPNGRFSFPVEGGGILTLIYRKDGFITAHRTVSVPWNGIAIADTLGLLTGDLASTIINFDGNAATVNTHQSTPVSDEFGTRSCTLVFTGDNRAYAQDDYGNDIFELTNISVRATEFVSPNLMPAILPPHSAYTYCSELKVDGIEQVRFKAPVSVWVENFLGFEVGEIVPVGYYDRRRGVWVASTNGLVVRLLDVNGDGISDSIDKDGDGIADDIVKGLENPDRYPPGSTFWKADVTHFSPWDFNWPFGPPPDSIPPNAEGPAMASQQMPEQRDCRVPTGSYVEERSGILHEDVSIPGAGINLHYASNRTEGYRILITVPASGSAVPTSLREIITRVEVAGRMLEKVLEAKPYQVAVFTWDGLDYLGRRAIGTIRARVSVGFVYNAVYYKSTDDATAAFARAGLRPTSIPARDTTTSWKKGDLFLRSFPGLGGQPRIASGWTLSNHHSASPTDFSVLYKGDGTIVQNTASLIETVAGNGIEGLSGEGGPAVEARLSISAISVGVDPSGNLFIADSNNARVRKVDENGIIYPYPTWLGYYQLPCQGLSVDSEGNIFFVTQDLFHGAVWKVTPGGEVKSILFDYGIADTAVDSHGNIYLCCFNRHRIAKIDTEGRITTIAGTGVPGFSGDGGPAINATLSNPCGITIDSSGVLYVSELSNNRIRRIDTSGIISSFAGNGERGFGGDGGPAVNARLNSPSGMATDSAGNLYFADTNNHRIRKVDAQGTIFTVVGNGIEGYGGDGGPPTQASLKFPYDVSLDASGSLYIADTGNYRIRKVSSPIGFIRIVAGEDVPFVEDDGRGYVLSSAGLQESSVDLDTGIKWYEFGYDQNKNLTTITDQFGSATIINRDGSGMPYEIVLPDGLVTSLTINPSNHLTRITYPDGSFYSFEYTDEGLLTAKVEPEGNRFVHEFDESGRLTDAFDENGGHWSFLRYRDERGDVHVDTLTAEGAATSYLDRNKSTGAYASMITDSFGTVTSYDQSFDGLTVTKALSCGMNLSFKYDLDPVYGFKYAKEMTEKSPAGLLKLTQKERNYQDTNADMIPDLITETTSINGKTTILQHNVLQAQKTLTSPQGRSTTTLYDPDSLLITNLLVPGLYEATFDYDSKGRLISILSNTRETTFTYDSRGFLDSVTDPQNHTTTYAHDPVGRVTSIGRPDGSILGFTYDKNGNMIVLSTPAAVDHAFNYNTVNLNNSYKTPLSGAYQYLYDGDRRLKQITFPSGATIKNQYDRERLMQILTPEGNVVFSYLCGTKVGSITKGTEKVSYAYDGSLLTSETLAGTLDKALYYAYDNDFNLKSLSYAGSTTNYTYDEDGLLIKAGSLAITRDDQNGLPTNVSGGSFSLARGFNRYGEIQSQDYFIEGTSRASWNVVRDNNGRIIQKTQSDAGIPSQFDYTYDSLGRLRTVASGGIILEEYRYGSNGARVYEMNTRRGISGRSFSYSREDHLLLVDMADSRTSYEYDVDGFLTKKRQGSSETDYSYSSRGELLKAVSPDGNIVEYVNDPLGRRIAKKVNSAIVEKYLWQGMTRLLAVYDGSDNLLMRFEYADDRVPAAMTRAGAVYYLTHDQVGSLRAVMDGAGNMVKQIDYDSFGNILYDSNPGMAMPFGFAGGLHDRDTGLVRFGFRDYDPDIGRWTAKDPIFFLGESFDLYGYVGNSPTATTDSAGLKGGVLIPLRKWIKKNLGAGSLIGSILEEAVDIPLTPSSILLYDFVNPSDAGVPDEDFLIPRQTEDADHQIIEEIMRKSWKYLEPYPSDPKVPVLSPCRSNGR